MRGPDEPHEPGCLGHHAGDCAVSGLFDLTDELIRLRSELLALRAVLLYPPGESSDGEVLAAARALVRMEPVSVCRICKTVPVPTGVHACEVCE